ncbi:MAG: ATP-binding protein [Firmicutes bacterium]|nr:ATP-binding protein [Bacillota bacterium]
MDKIIPFIDTPFIKILTGIRRCGKSSILSMLIDELKKRKINGEQIISYRFDSLEFDEIKTVKDLYTEVKSRLCDGKKTYLFFDEIQEIEEWEKAVNSLMSDFDVDIYITGSNSRMMSSEISTYLSGRYVSFKILPLTFGEYLDFRKSYTDINDTQKEFLHYLKIGGFPAVNIREYTPDEVYTVVRDIYNSTIFTDIVKSSKIRKIELLERIVKYAFNNIGKTFSALTLSKYIKSQNRTIDTETIYSYLEKLEKAYILHRCSRYDIKGKEYLKTQEKFYLADLSLRHAVLGYSPDSIPALMENVIYLELLSRGYDVYVGKFADTEVVFVAMKQENKLYVQVTYEINRNDTEKREYGKLLDIKDNYPKYVVRMDDLAGGNYEGIRTMHIADFLLCEEY